MLRGVGPDGGNYSLEGVLNGGREVPVDHQGSLAEEMSECAGWLMLLAGNSGKRTRVLALYRSAVRHSVLCLLQSVL